MARPALLYLHIPFCLRKCAYCDFYSESGHDDTVRVRYAAALRREMAREARHWDEYQINSMYFGGGTPSLLPAGEIIQTVAAAREHYNFTDQPEISLEINPAALASEYLPALREAGVNRLSVGVQSFNDDELRLLGRSHTVQHSLDLLKAIPAAGFANYSIDLIYGLPGQSMDAWRHDLRRAIATGSPHISAYLLQLDDDTPMGQKVNAGRLALPDQDQQADLYELAQYELLRAGYQQYEISNFALPGYASRHNLGYWRMHDYLGLGAGAVGRRGGRRRQNQPDLHRYIAALEQGGYPPRELLEDMDAAGLLTEALLMGLRLTAGVNLTALEAQFGVPVTPAQHHALNDCQAAGLLHRTDHHIRLTTRGLFLSNQVFSSLLLARV